MAGSGVSEEGRPQRQSLGTWRVSGVSVAKAASVTCCERGEWGVTESVREYERDEAMVHFGNPLRALTGNDSNGREKTHVQTVR